MDSPSLNTVVEAPATGLALFLACVFILYKIVKKRPGEHGTLPPGPRPWPLLGNLHQLGDLPHQSLAALAKKYGPLMFIRLGSIPAVVVSSPAMAKEFLKTHDRLFADRPTVSAGKYLAYEAKGMGYAPYGDYWRQMKRLCTLELLTPKRTENFISLREEEVATMIRSIWNESEQGARCVDLSKLFFSLTLNIVSRMSAGRTFSDQELSGGRKFKEILGEMMALAGAFVVADFIPLLEYIDLQGLRRRMKSLHQIYDEFGEKVIDEHINRRNQKAEEERGVKDLVDIMLDMSEAGSHSADLKVTRLNIKAIILDILIAGVETSSTTVDWAMRELLKNPCAMATAQQEIESVVGLGRNGLLKESDIKDCVYLRCLVKETLRLHPPGPLLIPHQSTEGRTVGRYHIPKRTRLFVNVWAMGRDESIWEDPYLFKPDRFMGKNIDLRGQHYELLPFGTGRRGCPGISMGLCVVELALAQLLHCFDWSVEGEVNMEEMFGLTVPGKFSISARPLWRLISGGANM